MIRVVVADDNKILLEQIVKGLKQSDKIEIVGIANNGIEELEYIKKFSPDVVITDIEMPEMSGIEVIETVKDFEKMPEFIVVTGGANGNIMSKLYTLPIKKIMYKPIDIEKLIYDIETIKEAEK